MNNLEVIKQVKSLLADYAAAQKNVEEMIGNSFDDEMALAGIVKFMQILGKKDPEKMAAVKELVSELDSLNK